jgi:hypothetical protein
LTLLTVNADSTELLNTKIYRHETRCIKLLFFASRMLQNSPTSICNSKNFSGGYTPGLPLKGEGEGKERGIGGEGMELRGGGRNKGGKGKDGEEGKERDG